MEPAVMSSRHPIMFAFWGQRGALARLALDLGRIAVSKTNDSPATISISRYNEIFRDYEGFGDALFPVDTFASTGIAMTHLPNIIRLRRDLDARLAADGARAFVTLMSHAWSPPLSSVLQRNKVRHVVVVHDADPHPGDRTALVNRWLLCEARAADHVVTLSKHVAQRLIRARGIPRDKITVLFHPDLEYACDRAPQPEGAPLRVLFFGRMLPYKGFDVFFNAVELLTRLGVPLGIGVFGLGDIEAFRPRLEMLGAEVHNRWIEENEIGGIFARHDLAVVTHTETSQSGVVAAAYGAGLPVVVTPAGGLVEQVVPGVTGLIAAATMPAAVAAAIRSLADDRGLLATLRKGVAANRDARSMERFFSAVTNIALAP